MRHHHQRQAVAVELLEQPEDAGAGRRVQIAGGLVAKQQAGSAHQCTRDGHALALTTRELERRKFGPVAQANANHRSQRPVAPALRRLPAVDLCQHHVFQHATVGQQVERLKDKANATTAHTGALPIGQRGDVDAIDQVPARTGLIQATDDVEQGGFARARWPGDGQPVAAMQFQVNVNQRIDRRVGTKTAAYLLQLQHHRVRRCGQLRARHARSHG